MSKYEAILFDLDGTLTDPQEGILNSIEYALQKFGIKVDRRESLISFIGPPLKESFQNFFKFDSHRSWQAVQFYREYFARQGLFENSVYPGILEMLGKLRADNRVLAVATSKPTIYAERILEHFNIRACFQLVVGSNLDGTKTAKTEVIEETLKGLPSVAKESIIMVGDREHDIIGAKNNLISSLGVTYGYGSEHELKAAGCDYLAGSVEDLGRFLLGY